MTDDILDDLFHGCALEAWLTTAHVTGRWPPDSKATRLLAYNYYESALKDRSLNDSPDAMIPVDKANLK